MKWLLFGEDLWGYVDGSEVKPGVGAADDGVRKWRKGNQKALYFIGTSIESELQVHIDNIENAKEAWGYHKESVSACVLNAKNSASQAILSTGVSVWRGYTYAC